MRSHALYRAGAGDGSAHSNRVCERTLAGDDSGTEHIRQVRCSHRYEKLSRSEEVASCPNGAAFRSMSSSSSEAEHRLVQSWVHWSEAPLRTAASQLHSICAVHCYDHSVVAADHFCSNWGVVLGGTAAVLCMGVLIASFPMRITSQRVLRGYVQGLHLLYLEDMGPTGTSKEVYRLDVGQHTYTLLENGQFDTIKQPEEV